MQRQTPQSEEQWLEVLSAYLDGELTPGEARVLEASLKTDARRREQLDGLRNTSNLLKTWAIDVPEPAPELIAMMSRNFTDERRERRDSAVHRLGLLLMGGRRLFWVWQMALFGFGVLTGVLGTRWAQRPIPSSLQSAMQSAAPPPIQLAMPISPAQAEVLFSETRAATLAERVMKQANAGQWREARAACQELLEKYPNSRAAADLEHNQAARLLNSDKFMARGI